MPAEQPIPGAGQQHGREGQRGRQPGTDALRAGPEEWTCRSTAETTTRRATTRVNHGLRPSDSITAATQAIATAATASGRSNRPVGWPRWRWTNAPR